MDIMNKVAKPLYPEGQLLGKLEEQKKKMENLD